MVLLASNFLCFLIDSRVQVLVQAFFFFFAMPSRCTLRVLLFFFFFHLMYSARWCIGDDPIQVVRGFSRPIAPGTCTCHGGVVGVGRGSVIYRHPYPPLSALFFDVFAHTQQKPGIEATLFPAVVCVFVCIVCVSNLVVLRSLVSPPRGTALELVYQSMADEERLLGEPRNNTYLCYRLLVQKLSAERTTGIIIAGFYQST